MPLKDKQKNNEYHKVYMQKVRSKLKTEKNHKEALIINEQFKAGNLNYGVKFDVPKALNWTEFQKENPNTKFWDYLEYKDSLVKPRVDKIYTPEQKQLSEVEEMKRIYLTEQLYGNDPRKPQLGMNFFHPEQEKTDQQRHEEENRHMRDKIKGILEHQ